ncbi:unnamed protein product, partial [Ceratitis capitata]
VSAFELQTWAPTASDCLACCAPHKVCLKCNTLTAWLRGWLAGWLVALLVCWLAVCHDMWAQCDVFIEKRYENN